MNQEYKLSLAETFLMQGMNFKLPMSIIHSLIFFSSRYLHFRGNQENRLPLSVTDRGMLGFGVPRPSNMGNLVFFGYQPADPNTYLERIILRNFTSITDITLSHFETNAPRLIFLDIRGCSQISREAVERFKAARTDCELLSNFDYEE